MLSLYKQRNFYMLNLLNEENLDTNEHQFKKIEDLEDGTSVYEIDSDEEDENPELSDFYENLADKMDETLLNKIAAELLDDVDQDKESRREWEQGVENGLKYAGIKTEEIPKLPFPSSCGAFDTTLTASLLRAYSTIKAELFPANGPCNMKTVGESTDQDDDQCERIKDWMNFFLTEKDKEYDADTSRLLLYTTAIGTTFRKVYQDPITKDPIARFIDPQDFIVNNNCVSILSSNRLTHVLHLSRKEIALRQASGFYREIELPNDDDDSDQKTGIKQVVQNLEGISTDQEEKKSALMTVYEIHCELDIQDFDDLLSEEDNISFPVPYIVSICVSSRKVLSIYRNWKEDDNQYKRINYFVQYNYFPGFGLYGIGLFQLLGSNAICLTSLQRMLIDKGTLSNFPGGLRVKGLRLENNDKAIGPSEFLEVETGGLPIRDAIMPMPYSEPSAVLNQLREALIQRTEALGSITESQLSEGNPNVPVGTTMMRLEVANRIQGIALVSIRNSLTNELQLLYKLFGETLPDQPYPFRVPGKNHVLMKEDFSDRFRIIPISDPVLTTAMQRNLQNQFVLQLAQSAPELYNMENVHRKVLEGLHVQDIDSLFVSKEEKAIAQFMQEQQMEKQTINPQQVMMMDIQQRQEAAALKHEESQLKAETEAFKAQLSFESEKNKQETEREIAEEKNETELELQHLKMQEREKDYV